MRGSVTTVSNIYPHSTAGPFFALSTYTGRQGLSSHHLPIQDGRVYPTSVHTCPHRTTGHFYPTSTLTAKMILAVGALCWDNSYKCSFIKPIKTYKILIGVRGGLAPNGVFFSCMCCGGGSGAEPVSVRPSVRACVRTYICRAKRPATLGKNCFGNHHLFF